MTFMQACPPELHAYVAYLACGDDYGKTIRSFSLVSRYFRKICQPFVYHSILVQGTQNILALDRSLQTTTTPHSHHLLLSTHSSKTPVTSQPVVQAIHRILTRCSPTLTTLAVDLSASNAESTLLFSQLFRIPFPRLQRLAIAGFYPIPTRSSHDKSSPNFPSLTHLHLSGNRNPHGLLHVGNLHKTFPVLTHLRISGLSMAVSFSLELHEALDSTPHSTVPSTPSTHPTSEADLRNASNAVSSSAINVSDPFELCFAAPSLPPTLTHLDIQPAPEMVFSPTISNATAMLKDAAMMARLRDISLERKAVGVDSQGVRFNLMQRGTVSRDLRLAWEQTL